MTARRQTPESAPGVAAEQGGVIQASLANARHPGAGLEEVVL